MGELVGNIHTYVVPGGESYTFEMRWMYDSWNRLINIQYPDGELVSYRYDNGGKLISMNGEKLGEQYNYIDMIIYDKFDSRTYIHYGNGTYSEYYYDPLNRRLKNLKSYDANGHKMHDIDYKYDGVGNILHQSNNGEYVYNGAGGPYNYNYNYDELYRLIQSEGNFESNNGNMYYNLNMSYSPSGNITNKQLYGQTLINGGVNNIDYNRNYQYDGRPHQVTSTGENEYEWDRNGNMIFRNTLHGKRYQCWDNEDRLVAVHDEGDMPQISAYLYDGGGERVWKLTGGVIQNYMNGQQIYSSGHLDKTLYASPYMVMTEKEYTKHYYIEGERICSKIGSGFQGAHTPPTSHPIDFIAGSAQICSMQLREMVGRNAQCAMYNGGIDIDPYLPPAHNDGNEYEKLQYFYHPDHLGSASFVTNTWGAVCQHLQYLPFGEIFVSQRNSEFDSRYKFTAKELDNETSYTYFGARYYDSELSGWLSVDPMSDKYPSTSAYMYCSGNPVNRIDPNGTLDDWVESANGDIYWDENATSQETTKEGETYLGKNVLVGTHNRDENLNEPINSAKFDLYLESNKTGPSATIYGNTVPADPTKYGTLAEGLYSAKFGHRNREIYKNELALRIYNLDGSDGLPTVNGNPNKADSDLLTGVLFHSGNPYQESLRDRAGNPVWSHGCQTSGCGPGSKGLHSAFMQKVGTDFNGAYYLRAKPQQVQNSFNFQLPAFTMPVDNTYVAPRVIF
jgi:RHS repeat-associated protein